MFVSKRAVFRAECQCSFWNVGYFSFFLAKSAIQQAVPVHDCTYVLQRPSLQLLLRNVVRDTYNVFLLILTCGEVLQPNPFARSKHLGR